MGIPARSGDSPLNGANTKLKQLAGEMHGILKSEGFWEEFTEHRATFSIEVKGSRGNTQSDAAVEAMNRISKSVVMYNNNYFDSKTCSSNFRNSIAPLLFMVAVHDLDPEQMENHRLDVVAVPTKLVEARDAFLQAKYAYIENSAKRINRETLSRTTESLLEQLAEVKGAEPAIGGKHVDVLIKAHQFCKEAEVGVGTPGARQT